MTKTGSQKNAINQESRIAGEGKKPSFSFFFFYENSRQLRLSLVSHSIFTGTYERRVNEVIYDFVGTFMAFPEWNVRIYRDHKSAMHRSQTATILHVTNVQPDA